MTAHFTPQTFAFLADLEANNSKDWFEANRDRYEADWKAPALAFIEALAGAMAALEPALKAEAKINGSLRRINRDVRFSKNKSPYSPSCHIVFWCGDHPNRSPGMHFSLHTGGVGYGAGMWGLAPAQLQTWRDMVVDAVEGPKVIAALDRAAEVGCTLGEPDLARLPKGYDAEGRSAQLLRHKSLVARTHGTAAKPDVLTEDGAMDWAMEMTHALMPVIRIAAFL
ncbi:MAG: DUF2461 domain-containing protein [Paracoccaceae bacterium]|nr:DUF2461 domain-containing protein [Paracoccaceae bacterium]